MDIPQEFENIYINNKEKIFNLAYRFTGNQTDAEDITQEVFLRAFKNYKNFRFESEIYSWLYKIAINACREKIRQKQRLKKNVKEVISIDRTTEDSNGEPLEVQIEDKTDVGPEISVEKKHIQECIRKEIEKLPAKYSEVIILKELENMSYEEVSKILNISIDAIGVRLIRARNILKKKLKKYL